MVMIMTKMKRGAYMDSEYQNGYLDALASIGAFIKGVSSVTLHDKHDLKLVTRHIKDERKTQERINNELHT